MGLCKTVVANFDENSGVAMFTVRYKNQEFTGAAICHDEDKDMQSELVGLSLAQQRATIDVIKYRRAELLTRIETLEGAFRHVARSKDFDLTSTYSSNFQKLICEARCERQELKDLLVKLENNIKEGINARDELYQKIREKRKA